MPVYRVTLFSTMFGQEIRNVMQFFKNAGVQADMLDLTTRIINGWLGQTRFLSCGDLVYYKVKVEVPSHTEWTPLETSITAPGLAGASNTRNLTVAMVLRIKTANHSRAGTGRHYVAGIRQDGLVLGRFDTGTMNEGQSVSNSLLSQFSNLPANNGWLLGVGPRVNPDSDFKGVISIAPRDYPGTQTRRNFKRGS